MCVCMYVYTYTHICISIPYPYPIYTRPTKKSIYVHTHIYTCIHKTQKKTRLLHRELRGVALGDAELLQALNLHGAEPFSSGNEAAEEHLFLVCICRGVCVCS